MRYVFFLSGIYARNYQCWVLRPTRILRLMLNLYSLLSLSDNINLDLVLQNKNLSPFFLLFFVGKWIWASMLLLFLFHNVHLRYHQRAIFPELWILKEKLTGPAPRRNGIHIGTYKIVNLIAVLSTFIALTIRTPKHAKKPIVNIN